MQPRQDPPPQLLELARLQSNALSLEQMRGHAFPDASARRLVAHGVWQRLDRTVYLASPEPAGWLGLAWAGILLGGPEARLGADAAGHLHGLVAEAPTPITVLVPDARPLVSRYPWHFRRERPGVRETRSPGNPPRTTVEDTVLDLCDQGRERDVVGWVTDAIQKQRTTVPRLRAALARRPRAKHRRLLVELLGDVGEGVQSALELRYLRDVERPHALPTGERQHRGRLPFVRDVYYRRYRLVVELDGRLGHEGRGAFRDAWRDNLGVLDGDTTLRFGHVDVADRPCEVNQVVATALHHRGWSGPSLRCHRCRKIA